MIAWENSRHLATLPLVFPAKWRLRNECRKSILTTRHYPCELDSASDWLNQISHAAWPIRSTTQFWLVTRHQYGISALVFQTSFGGETSGSVAKCRLFSQAISTTSYYLWYISREPYHFSKIQTINYLFHFFKYQLFEVANLVTIFRIESPVPKF